MSFRAVTWAFDVVRGLGASEKLVLLALAEFANDEDETWRSREEIAVRAECSVRTVDAHLKRLEGAGLIERLPRYAWCSSDKPECANRGAHKHRSGTLYRVNVGAVPRAGKVTPSTVAKVATVEETLELSQKSHTCKSCNCGEGEGPTVASLRSPQSQELRTHMIIEPPIEPPYLTEPEPVANLRVVENSHGQVRSGALTRSKAGNELSQAEAAILASCVPSSMQAMDTTSAREVADLLRERLEVGWKPFEIRQILDAPLPSDVGHLGSLVAYRIRENICLTGAPARLRAQAEQAHRQAEEERLAAYSEPFEIDPQMLEFYADLERSEPGLPHSQKAIRWHNYQREQRSREGVRAHV